MFTQNQTQENTTNSSIKAHLTEAYLPSKEALPDLPKHSPTSVEMFARVATVFTFLFFALPMLAAATAVPRDGGSCSASCSTGPIQCCNSVQSANSNPVQLLAGLLGIALGTITGQVGLTCNPISVIGIGGNSCSGQTVCCTNNSFNGVIALGCTPINVNL